MTVIELISKLQEFPPDLEVTITDGFSASVFHGDFEVQKFLDCDGYPSVDIGVGGTEV